MNERITTCGIVLECKKVLVAKRSVGAKTCGLWEFVGGKNRYELKPRQHRGLPAKRFVKHPFVEFEPG